MLFKEVAPKDPIVVNGEEKDRFDLFNKEMQVKRLMKRDSINEELANKTLDAQMDIEEKKNLANIVFDNSVTILNLAKQLCSLIKSCHNIKEEV